LLNFGFFVKLIFFIIAFSNLGVSPVQKFNIGRDIFSISFINGSSYLLTAGQNKLGKGRTLCLWDMLTRQYLQPKLQWELNELNQAASALAISSIFKVRFKEILLPKILVLLQI